MPDSEQFQQFFIELAKQQLSAEITGAGDTQDPPPTYYCGCSLSVVITPAISDDMAAGSPVLEAVIRERRSWSAWSNAIQQRQGGAENGQLLLMMESIFRSIRLTSHGKTQSSIYLFSFSHLLVLVW